jgi:predicted GNAT family N-acyltransferase
MKIEEHTKDNYTISTDKSKLDLDIIHGFLSHSYWAESIPLSIVKKAIENSLCFGVYRDDQQIGFARVISDYATFAYLADVFIIESERGNKLSVWLMQCILEHSELQGLRNFCLMTQDAHSLYEKFGFKNIPKPQNFMAKKIDDIYKRKPVTP